MRWLKTAQSGTAEVLYLVSLCSFQWVCVSNVGTRRQKARFALQLQANVKLRCIRVLKRYI